MGGRLNLDEGTLNLDGGTRPPSTACRGVIADEEVEANDSQVGCLGLNEGAQKELLWASAGVMS